VLGTSLRRTHALDAVDWQCQQLANVANWQCNAGSPRALDDVMSMMMYDLIT
jgi:hypothetical protein